MKKMDDKRELTKEGTGIFLFFLSLFLLLSFLSFDPQDPGLFTSSSNQVKNILGPVGSWTADLFFGLFGLPAYLLIALLLIASYRLFVVREGRLFPWDRVVGTLLLLLSAGTILHLLSPTLPFRSKELLSGGQVGQFLSITGERLFRPLGVSLVSLTVLCLALILSFHFSFRRTLARLIALFRFLKQRSEIQRERKRRATADEPKERPPSKRTKSPPQPEVPLSPVAGLPLEADLPLPVDSRILEKPSTSGLQEEKLSPLPMTGNPLPWEEEKGNGGTSFSLDGHEESLNLPPPAQTPKKILLTPRPQDLRKPTEKGKKGYELPPLSLLDLPSEKGPVVDSQELNVKKTIIEEKLREFNIEGKVVEYHPGPVISTFEYLPEKGVKIAQIISLAEDLSMALKAENVRISRIKGKATLGIEIPNYKRQLINLREILENPVFRDSESLLTFSLGKNVRGTPVVTALDSMPHLLIAGATGMGKSVAIHSIILSILYRATPEEVKFILVDPKRLEFSLYEQLPHLLTKIVLDPKEASQALKWGIYEMEKRLKILASFQTRNIKMYNRKVKDLKEGRGEMPEGITEADLVLMPYIIIIIDELADLMMVASKDVENSIARLAQMARAAGIHLILATQRPSVDVITGTIKNNLPSRIALTVPSRHDSATIIDSPGAEKLLGKGDMLFMPPASQALIRVHGSYVSEEEIARCVKFVRSQSKPKFDSQIILAPPVSEGGDEEGGEVDVNDPEFIEAVKIVVTTGKASASFLQRRMKIGYNKAARYVEIMEEQGIVGAGQGSKPRDVLVGEEFLEQLLHKKFNQ